MQEFVSILKYILQSNLINFILMLIILCWIVKKVNMGKSFDNSIASVESGIKKSDNEKLESQEKLKSAQTLIDNLPNDVAELKKSSKDKSEIFKAEIDSNAQKSILSFEKNIESILEVEEKKISNVLTDKTTTASVELAKAHIMKLLQENPELHNKFISDSLDELGKVKL